MNGEMEKGHRYHTGSDVYLNKDGEVALWEIDSRIKEVTWSGDMQYIRYYYEVSRTGQPSLRVPASQVSRDKKAVASVPVTEIAVPAEVAPVQDPPECWIWGKFKPGDRLRCLDLKGGFREVCILSCIRITTEYQSVVIAGPPVCIEYEVQCLQDGVISGPAIRVPKERLFYADDIDPEIRAALPDTCPYVAPGTYTVVLARGYERRWYKRLEEGYVIGSRMNGNIPEYKVRYERRVDEPHGLAWFPFSALHAGYTEAFAAELSSYFDTLVKDMPGGPFTEMKRDCIAELLAKKEKSYPEHMKEKQRDESEKGE